MKRTICTLIIPLLAAFLGPASAQDITIPAPSEVNESETSRFNDSSFGAIAAFSHTFSATTGIAMSPLLGMGVLGAWQYYQSDEAYRQGLPWYSEPWIWGVCLAFFLLLKSKDTLGAWIPELVKKPITVLDDVAEKASALIVALAVVPAAVWTELEKYYPREATETPLAMAPIVFSAVVTAVAVIAFIIVWFTFNALSSIKILSPSSLINSAISLFKGVIIAVFAALAALNPWIGLALSIIILLICAFIFGWAFRWNVFGTLFVKDFFTSAFNKPLQQGEPLKGFSTSHFPGVKSRTYGRITRQEDELVFSWKPWLFLPTQKSRINIANTKTGARKGLFLPSVTIIDSESDRERSVIDFRLRFRSHAEEIQAQLGLDSVKPNLVLSGVRASWKWFRDQVQRSSSSVARALQSDGSSTAV